MLGISRTDRELLVRVRGQVGTVFLTQAAARQKWLPNDGNSRLDPFQPIDRQQLCLVSLSIKRVCCIARFTPSSTLTTSRTSTDVAAGSATLQCTPTTTSLCLRAAMECWEKYENGSVLPSKGAEWLREQLSRDGTHAARADAVRAAILSRKAGQKVAIRKPGINHTPHSRDYKKTACLVDVTSLTNVIKCVRKTTSKSKCSDAGIHRGVCG